MDEYEPENIYDDNENGNIYDHRPELTEASRYATLSNMAYELAYKKLKEGTATSQLITVCLKLGSANRDMQDELLKCQVELVKAKTDSIRQAEDTKALVEQVKEAMTRYSPTNTDNI